MRSSMLWIVVVAAVMLSSACASAAAVPASPTPLPATVTSVPAAAQTPTPSVLGEDIPPIVSKLHFFGEASVLYHGAQNVYFDPARLEGTLPPADIILISHNHDEHRDLESMKKILTPDTVLIISSNVIPFYESNKAAIGVPAAVLDEGQVKEVGRIRIEAVPAFGRNHNRDTQGAGYVVTIDGDVVYFAGGTYYFPEMADIESDVTLYPWYTNDDFLKAAAVLPTRVMIPVHTDALGLRAFMKVYGPKITRVILVGLMPGPYNP
jgi:L-ascorbate metabolism protein UlaG (beta-lactamase superfamily)